MLTSNVLHTTHADHSSSSSTQAVEGSTASTDLVPINILDFRKNSPEFYRVMEYMQREQSARFIQRFWRKKHPAVKQPRRYIETLAGPLSLRFIKMPSKTECYLDHARKIRKGQWLALNFDDPDAIRNLYAASAYRVITADQLVTAILLHSAKKMFGNTTIRQHIFSEKIPYDYTNIDYITKEKITNFENSLSKISETDRYYFSINLSHRLAVAYLIYALEKEFHDKTVVKLKTFTINYIKSRKINERLQNKLIKDIQKEFIYKCQSIENALRFVSMTEPESASIVNSKSLDILNIDFILEGSRLAEAIPEFEMSPDFDASNPDSPLFCMIVHTMAAFKSLQTALHGKDATLPMYVAGRFSPLLIRQADEGAAWFKPTQRRPVELPHPDLIPDNNPHGIPANEFGMLFHDLFHVCRNGVNQHKSFLRTLRQYLEVEKSFIMSKGIWRLTDMDFEDSKKMRLYANNPTERTKRLYNFLTMVIYFGCNLSNKVDTQHLLLLAGLIKNSTAWRPLLNNISLDEWMSSKNNDYKDIYSKMSAMIQADLKNGKIYSGTYYVLRARLYIEKEGIGLCKALDETDIIAWRRNGGMYIKACYTKTGCDIPIELSRAAIVNDLQAALDIFKILNPIEIVLENESSKKILNEVIRKTNNTSSIKHGLSDNRYIISRVWLKHVLRTSAQDYCKIKHATENTASAHIIKRI